MSSPLSLKCALGGIGRPAVFRSQCRKVCRFESDRAYQVLDVEFYVLVWYNGCALGFHPRDRSSILLTRTKFNNPIDNDRRIGAESRLREKWDVV